MKTTDVKCHFFWYQGCIPSCSLFLLLTWVTGVDSDLVSILQLHFLWLLHCMKWRKSSCKPHQQGKRWGGGVYSAWKTHFEVFVSVMCFRLGSTLLYNQDRPWTCDFSANISWVLVPPCWEASILPTKQHSLFHSLSIFSSTEQRDSLWSWRISVPPHPTSLYNCIL